MSKVLIVDDRELNRYLRGRILRSAGYEAVEAVGGLEAVEKCRTEKPDLVLLDIHLPDINGFEVCRRIKADPDMASIMVMQISASAVELRDAIRGLDGGADDFLLEPVEPELMVAKVQSLLRLRSVEERLRRSNADLTRFALVVSHDLQEPLRTMITFMELLNRDYRDSLDERGKEYVDFVVSGGQRMNSLIHDLLDYSRVSTPSQETELVDVQAVVAEAREWLQEPLKAAQATFECDSLPRIFGAKVRLAQLIRNLLENSVRYRREDVPLKIRITATSGPREWLFTFADNGKGFSPSANDKIFAVFHRLDTADRSGSGVGLAICRAIVETGGGKIWAEGHPDEGATFYFTWPVVAAPAAAPSIALIGGHAASG